LICKIIKEGSIARGRRRIEAVVGSKAVTHLQTVTAQLNTLSSILNVDINSVQDKVQHLLSERISLKAEVNSLKAQLANRTVTVSQETTSIIEENVWKGELHGNKVVVCESLEATADLSFLRKRGATIAQKYPEAILVLLNKSHIITMASVSGVHSGTVLKDVLAVVGGKGGGSAKYAEGKFDAEISSKIIQNLKKVLCTQPINGGA